MLSLHDVKFCLTITKSPFSMQALSSYVFIAANVILHESELAVQRKHLNELLPPIIPLLTSHHHSLRGFTQVQLCSFTKHSSIMVFNCVNLHGSSSAFSATSFPCTLQTVAYYDY